jgi:hypothetical protein
MLHGYAVFRYASYRQPSLVLVLTSSIDAVSPGVESGGVQPAATSATATTTSDHRAKVCVIRCFSAIGRAREQRDAMIA